MTNQSYSDQIPLSTAELLDCGYAATLADVPCANYPELSELLFAVAHAAQADYPRRALALRLLGGVCTMHLDPDDLAEPYKAGWIMDDRRSLTPGDLDTSTLITLADATPAITHPLLRARLADLLWLLQRPREIRSLLLAIDAFREWIGTPTLERWNGGQDVCTVRALQLATFAQAAANDRYEAIEQALLMAFDAAPDDSNYPAFWLVEPLLRFRRGKARAQDIAQRLERIGEGRRAKRDGLAARAYLASAERWYKTADNGAAAYRVLGVSARSFEEEGDTHASRLIAMNLYDKAIQIWRDMPRRQRLELDGETRIDTLRGKLAEAGRNVVDEEMQTITMPPVDLSELIELTRADLSGRETTDALSTFAHLYDGPDFDELHRSVQELHGSSLFGQLFGSVTLSSDGRPIAKVDAAIGGADAGRDATAQQMIQEFMREAEMISQGQLRPALEVLRYEHNLRRRDWEALATESIIVPRDRVSLVARGLHAGYQGDLVSALHLLTPQLEHMVRYHLQRARAHTSTIDQAIVMEKGLSSLVTMPEMEATFGKNLTFEIRALFCDQHGPNFRNNLAHGLILEHQLYGRLGLYAWWMVFRLVFNVFWNRRRQSPEAELDDATEDVLQPGTPSEH